MPKTIRLNAIRYFIIKIPKKKKELRQIASNHLPDIEFKDFIKSYKDYRNYLKEGPGLNERPLQMNALLHS